MEHDPTLYSERGELAELCRTASHGLCFLDTELRYVRVSDRLATSIGRPARELIGLVVGEVTPEMASSLEPPFKPDRKQIQLGEG